MPYPIQNCLSQRGVHISSFTKPLCALELAVAVLQYVPQWMPFLATESFYSQRVA